MNNTVSQGNERESAALLASKIRCVEREIDKLSDELKSAYFIALEQEIKQKTDYVRNAKFIAAFLRAVHFDVPKAALRMANFYKHKLDLFGSEKLSRRILQDDLDPKDREVLSSGYMHNVGEDRIGRAVIFIKRDQLHSTGLCNENYIKSIARVFFYHIMHAIEKNEEYQNTGFALIPWGLNCTLPVKDYRILFFALLKLIFGALPMRFTFIHNCISNPVDRVCMSWVDSIRPKSSGFLREIHGPNIKDCISGLSNHGVDINALPIAAADGAFKSEVIQNGVEQMRQSEMMSTTLIRSKDNKESLNPENGSTTVNGETKNYDQSNERHKHTATASKASEEFEQFCMKLMEILEGNYMPDAIWWSRGGISFVIEKEKFTEKVLPEQFNGIRLESFLRRLRRWKFQRLSDNENMGSKCVEYQHRLFKKNAPQLVREWHLHHNDLPKKESFPAKLKNVLDGNKAKDAIWWVCDGKAFAIEKSNFTSEVLKNYFDGLKSDSFYRMLRKWGFKRILDEEISLGSALVFHNVDFQKDLPLSEERLKKLNLTSKSGEINNTSKQGGQKLSSKFVKRVYKILVNNTAPNAIWWVDKGNTFAIQEVLFSHNVLPKQFNGIKFSSFLRSLSRWGFKRMHIEDETLDKNIIFYQHPLFKKDSPQLLDKWNEIESNGGDENLESQSKPTSTVEQDTSVSMSMTEKNTPHVVGGTNLRNNKDDEPSSIKQSANILSLLRHCSNAHSMMFEHDQQSLRRRLLTNLVESTTSHHHHHQQQEPSSTLNSHHILAAHQGLMMSRNAIGLNLHYGSARPPIMYPHHLPSTFQQQQQPQMNLSQIQGLNIPSIATNSSSTTGGQTALPLLPQNDINLARWLIMQQNRKKEEGRL